MTIQALSATDFVGISQLSKAVENIEDSRLLMTEFEKIMMRVMLEPLQKSMPGTEAAFTGITTDVMMMAIADQLAMEFNSGLHDIYKQAL